MSICIGADHAGLFLKGLLISLIQDETEFELLDFGTNSSDSVDYIDYAIKVGEAVSQGKCSRGILVCGSGIGMSIVANKFQGVRAALCHDLKTAELSRRHNDSNVLVLGERVVDSALAILIVTKWLDTPFDGGRHEKRIDKIRELELRLYR